MCRQGYGHRLLLYAPSSSNVDGSSMRWLYGLLCSTCMTHGCRGRAQHTAQSMPPMLCAGPSQPGGLMASLSLTSSSLTMGSAALT